MIYFLGVVVSTIFTVALGFLMYYSDEDITVGNLVSGLFMCCMSWSGVLGYIAILLTFGIDYLLHQDSWMNVVFTRKEKREDNEDNEDDENDEDNE